MTSYAGVVSMALLGSFVSIHTNIPETSVLVIHPPGDHLICKKALRTNILTCSLHNRKKIGHGLTSQLGD